MSIFLHEKARDCEALDGQHSSGHQEAGNDELPSKPYYNRWAHLREQQKARDYWVRVYGYEAELLSRGGVSWLGGW